MKWSLQNKTLIQLLTYLPDIQFFCLRQTTCNDNFSVLHWENLNFKAQTLDINVILIINK